MEDARCGIIVEWAISIKRNKTIDPTLKIQFGDYCRMGYFLCSERNSPLTQLLRIILGIIVARAAPVSIFRD